MQNRAIVKRLYELALKEYREKRPVGIVGYRVKLSVLLQRGYGPSLILSGLKGQAVPFLLLANYGDNYRLYYILEDGRMISAINIPTADFEREQLKFQKATTKLFEIPKPEVPENKIEKVKKQLNEKFQHYIEVIKKQTSCNVRKIPLITIYQPSLEEKLVIKREPDFIKFPLELVTHNLIDGFLITEAYKLIFPKFVRKTKQMRLFCNIGAYFLLTKTLKQDWLDYWEPKMPFKAKITQLNEPLFHSFIHFLCYLGKFETDSFDDEQFEKIFSIFSEISLKTESNPEIAAHSYLQLANHEGLFVLKAALFFILANKMDDALKILKELAKFTQSEDIKKIRILCEQLATFQLSKIYSASVEIESISLNIQKLFIGALEQIKNRVLEIKRLHKENARVDESITIKLEIRNMTDLTFQNLVLKDELPKKRFINLISSNTFQFAQILPKKIVKVEYQLSTHIPSKIRFDNGSITFEDSYGNRYTQSISPTFIIIT